jgi:hypothetical protein
MWISYRTPKNRKLDLTSNKYYYEKPGKYLISVKVIDILGNETTEIDILGNETTEDYEIMID